MCINLRCAQMNELGAARAAPGSRSVTGCGTVGHALAQGLLGNPARVGHDAKVVGGHRHGGEELCRQHSTTRRCPFLRALDGTAASSSSPTALIQAWLAVKEKQEAEEDGDDDGGGGDEDTETAVLVEVASTDGDSYAAPWPLGRFDLVDLRRRFVEHFGSLLCRGLFASTSTRML